jgi:hypothetical protein
MATKKRVDQYSIRVMKAIPYLPYPEEEKKAWLEELEREGLSEYLAQQISEKIPDLVKPEDESEARRMQATILKVTQAIRQWRLNEGLKNTRNARR